MSSRGFSSLGNPVAEKTYQAACSYRLQRVQAQLIENNCDAILLYDPVNIRYATDTSNMQVWTMHNWARYVLVFAQGPVILWDFVGCEHLTAGNLQVDDVRPAVNFSYFCSGSRATELAKRWVTDLCSVLSKHTGNHPKLAVDRGDFDGLTLLSEKGVELCDGHALMEQARLVKSADELALMRWTMRVCESGMQRMYDENKPGITERELWAWLHFENIRHGGEWIETRLVASGPRTNPWMQECSDRILQTGDLFCFDTDLIGPYGYIADVSRAWTVGNVEPTNAQRDLYRLAHEQVVTNADLLKPGVSFKEISQRAWLIPEAYYKNRYCFVMHGVGMCDEYPGIAHAGEDWQSSGYDGVLEENMTISVESYIGKEGGSEGVKLEQQYLVTKDGALSMCDFPWQDSWL